MGGHLDSSCDVAGLDKKLRGPCSLLPHSQPLHLVLFVCDLLRRNILIFVRFVKKKFFLMDTTFILCVYFFVQHFK